MHRGRLIINSWFFKVLQPNDNPYNMELCHTPIWIQVHDVPVGYTSEVVAKSMGNRLGTFISSDPNNFTGGWREYLHIRVDIDVTKSLRKDAKLKRGTGDCFTVILKYERLPQFCFTYGRIGHTDRSCLWPPKLNTRDIVKEFGPFMRAGNRR